MRTCAIITLLGSVLSSAYSDGIPIHPASGICSVAADRETDLWHTWIVDDSSFGNGVCDPWLNKEVYLFDGGDCCECPCVDGSEDSCEHINFNCLDPNSGCASPKIAIYANCSGDVGLIGDGDCDSFNNNQVCGYDGGDCCRCNNVTSGNPLCLDPQSECVNPVISTYANCTGNLAYYGDGFCQSFNNVASCGFDGGDCCQCSCTADRSCVTDDSNCLDSSTSRIIYDCKESPPSPLPCPRDYLRSWVVTNTSHIRDLAETVYCTGGTFEVEWEGTITVKTPIFVVGGTVLRITGSDSSAAADGGGFSRIFSVSNASLHVTSMIFQNGKAKFGGAVAATTSSTLIFNTTVFLGNEAIRDGGALFVSENSNVLFDGQSNFYNNRARASGGALHVVGGSTASFIDKARFERNIAAYGGAIYVTDDSSASFTRAARIVNNTAVYTGGALVVRDESTVSLSGDCFLSLNHAGASGGGVYLNNNSVVLWEGLGRFANNTASDGGALYAESSNITGRGQAHFYGNLATYSGGAIVLSGSTCSWDGNTSYASNTAIHRVGGAISASRCSRLSWEGETTFESNSAGENGGALSLEGASRVSWTATTTFFDNHSGLDGGALSVSHGSLSFWRVRTVFLGNSASSKGGALLVNQRSSVSWSGTSTFSSNTAQCGGAVFVMGSSHVKWSGNTHFLANTAAEDGGALGLTSFASSATSAVSRGAQDEPFLVINGGTTFENNTCGANGGGMAVLAPLSVLFETVNVTFFNNSAGMFGGAIFLEGTGIGQCMVGLSFISNSALIGGAVFGSDNVVGNDNAVGNSITYLRCDFFGNVAVIGGAVGSIDRGMDYFIDSSFKRNSARKGGALRIAGKVSISNCSFIDNNVSDDGEGPAVSILGYKSKLEGVYFSGNVFSCDVGKFHPFLEVNRSIFDTVCGGCRIPCEGCFFHEPNDVQIAPECVHLLDAGLEHASSSGGMTSISEIKIDKGYWRSTSNSTKVVECFNTDACQGGVTGAPTFCRSGYKGPYCSVCTDGCFPLRGHVCTRLLVATVVGILLACWSAWAVVKYLVSAKTAGPARGIVPLHSLKMLVIPWQIMSQFASVTQTTYPSAVQTFLNVMDSSVNFDPSWILITARIVEIDFHERLLIVTLWPLVVIGLIICLYAFEAHRKRVGQTSGEGLENTRRRCISVIIWLMVLVYSNTSSVVLQTFDCVALDDGKLYLRADYSIECDQPKHRAVAIYAIFMAALYALGIPTLFAYVLFISRNAFKHPNTTDDVLVKSISSLWEQYKPSRHYYEAIECARRICLTSLAALLVQNNVMRCVLTLVFAFAFAILSERLNPYISNLHSWLNRIGHTVVFVGFFFVSFNRDDGRDFQEDPSWRKAGVIILLLTICSMAFLVVFEYLFNMLISWRASEPSSNDSSSSSPFIDNLKNLVATWMTGSQPNRAVVPTECRGVTSVDSDHSEEPVQSVFTSPLDSSVELAYPWFTLHSSAHEPRYPAARLSGRFACGEDSEVLASVLNDGEIYESEQGDVRLTVPCGSLRGPGPGPIRLQYGAQILHGEDHDFFADTIVQCPPRSQFKTPLQLDFLLDDPTISSYNGSMSGVLEKYQVLRKEEEDDWWQPLEKRDMLVIRRRGATCLRARIHHFTMFSCCRITDVNNGYLHGAQKDSSKVGVHNATDARVLLIMLPLKFTTSNQRRHSVQFMLGTGGVEAGLGFERTVRQEYISLPLGESPSSMLLEPHARKQQLGVREKKAKERLLVCTVHDHGVTTPPPSSSTSDSTRAPSSLSFGRSFSGGHDEQILRFWDNLIVSGGDTLALLPSRLEGGCQRSCIVNKQGSVLAHVAMALAGLGWSIEDTEMSKTPSADTSTTGWSLNPFSSKIWR